MLEEIKKEREDYQLTTNPNERNLILQSLGVLDANTQFFLVNLEDEEEKSKLINLIKKKKEELKVFFNTEEATKNSDEELRQKFLYYDKLNMYLGCLLRKNMHTNIDLIELKDLYEGLLLANISKEEKELITTNGEVVDYDMLAKIVSYSDNKSISSYFEMKKEEDTLEAYLNSRDKALRSLNYLLNNIDVIEVYKLFLNRYFFLTKKDKSIREELKDANLKYSKISKRLFGRKKKEELLNLISHIKDKLDVNNKEINKVKRYVEMLIDKLANEKISYLLMNNKRIVFALDYMPYTKNPFLANNLDVTFTEAMNSANPDDLQYFIISNLHNITEDNLKEMINYLKELTKRYERVLDSKRLNIVGLMDGMFLDEKEIISDSYLGAFIDKVNNVSDENGIKLIHYIKMLLNIHNSNLTIDDVIDVINYPYNLTYNPLNKQRERVLK